MRSLMLMHRIAARKSSVRYEIYSTVADGGEADLGRIP